MDNNFFKPEDLIDLCGTWNEATLKDINDRAIVFAEAYAAKLEQKQHLVDLMRMDEEKDGEQCFTVDDIEKVWWIDRHAALAHLNAKASRYATDRAKRVLEKAAENATTKKLDGGLPVVMIVDKESITNSKNLEV